MKPPITPPPIRIVETVSPTVTDTLPVELVRPPSLKDKEYVATTDDDGDWFLSVSENGECRHLKESEAKQVASMMNEQGSNIITLFCRTEKCKYKGTWLKRTSEDVKKNIYYCEGCKQGMTR